MPARREPHTPPTTPPKQRSRRHGSGSSSLSSQSSPKYTAYLKERPSPTSNGTSYLESPFSRENEIFGRLSLANSQPTIYNNDINDDSTNQFDRSIIGVIDDNNNNNNNNSINNINNNDNNNNDNINNINNNNNRFGLLTKLLDFIGFMIYLLFYFIKSCFNFIWKILSSPFTYFIPRTTSSTTTTTTSTTTSPSSSPSSTTSPTSPSSNTSNTTTIINKKSNNKLLMGLFVGLLIFIIIILLLLLLLNAKFGVENNSFMKYFSSDYDKIHIYKIKPIKKNDSSEIDNKNDGSITLTIEDFRQMIITEVRNHLNSENGKNSLTLPTEPLRNMISNEVKQITNEFKSIVTSEIKKSLSNVRTDPTTRFRGGSLRGEEMIEIIRKEARHVVKDELLKYSQDKLNKPDFALYSGGAKIISKLTSKTYELWPDKWFKKAFAYLSGQGILRGKPPVTAISHDTNVGQCWPFPGHEGRLAVFLNRRVFVKAVTYDHVSKDIAVEVNSAPKDFEVWGIVDDGTGANESKDDGEELDIDNTLRNYMESTEDSCGRREDGEYVPGNLKSGLNGGGGSDGDDELSNIKPSIENLTNGDLSNLGSSSLHFYLGKFTYDIDGLPVQTFEISQNILKNNRPIRAIIMRIKSNWGKPEYTCLYRFRVHGEPADKADN